MSDRQYVKSATPGKHWDIYTYKPQGRPGYAYAVEGEVSDDGRSFSYILHQARSIREDIPGRMTTKSRNVGLQRLWDRMQEAGLIAEGETLKPVA
jgi:hypothetical protein